MALLFHRLLKERSRVWSWRAKRWPCSWAMVSLQVLQRSRSRRYQGWFSIEMLIRQQSDTFWRRKDSLYSDCWSRCWQNQSQFLRSSFYWSNVWLEGLRLKAWICTSRIACFYYSRSFLFRYSSSSSSRMRTNYNGGYCCCLADAFCSLQIGVAACCIQQLQTTYTRYAVTFSYLLVSMILSSCAAFSPFYVFFFRKTRNRKTAMATTLSTIDRCTNSNLIFAFLLIIPVNKYITIATLIVLILNKESRRIHPRLLLNHPLVLLLAHHVRAIFRDLPRALPLVEDHELDPVVGEDDCGKDGEHAPDGLEVVAVADEADPTAGLVGEVGHESAEAHPEEHHLVGLPHEFHVLLLARLAEAHVVPAVWRLGVDQVVVAPLHVLLIASRLWL